MQALALPSDEPLCVGTMDASRSGTILVPSSMGQTRCFTPLNLLIRIIGLTSANPDGKYLLKGGTPAVWDAFGLPDKWRSKLGEGVIEGKRCGVTQNIGPACRKQGSRQSQRIKSAVV
jgi:hypothetical protein